MAAKFCLFLYMSWIYSIYIQDTVAYYDVEIDIVGRPSVQGQGTLDQKGSASKANDGNEDTDHENGLGCAATQSGVEPWWQVDLGAQKSIVRVEALNRGDCCSGDLGPFDVLVANDTYDVVSKPATIPCGSHEGEVESGVWGTATCDDPVQGRYVIIKLPGSEDRQLTMCEVKIYARIQHTLSRVAAESDVNKSYATIVGQYSFDEIAPIPSVNNEVGTGYFSLQKSDQLMFKSPLVDCAWDRIQTVQVSVLQNQAIRMSFDFDTSSSSDNKNSFYGADYLRSNTYEDLSTQFYNEQCEPDPGAFFSIEGHGPNANHPHDRRFFVHCTYGGCDADWGWFVILDMDHSKVCHWEIEVGANPIFLFSGEKVQSATVGWSAGDVLLITADVGDAFGGCISDCVSVSDGNYQSCLACNVYVTCTSDSLKYKLCQRGTSFDSSTRSCVASSTTCIEEGFAPEGCYPDDCSPNPCQNDGTCSTAAEGWTCNCQDGFKGAECEKIDGCHGNPCQNNGVCTDADDRGSVQYTCACANHYSGDNCEEFDACSSSPCQNNGNCEDLDDNDGSSAQYTCTCTNNYAGDMCQNQKICSTSNPCGNGDCVDGPDGTTYTCSCNAGYSGTNCDVFTGCTSNPCENGGTCSTDNNEVHCSCTAGYNGDVCDEITACNSSPCQNDGTCNDDGSSVQYTCTCPNDYAGDNCQNHKLCSRSSPCKNGGRCVDGTDGMTYSCACNEGYTGTNCDEEDNQQGSAAAQTEDDSSNGMSLQNPIVFYSLIAALAVAVLIICCTFIVACRRKKKEQEEDKEHKERQAWASKKELDNGPMASQAKHPPAKVKRSQPFNELVDF